MRITINGDLFSDLANDNVEELIESGRILTTDINKLKELNDKIIDIFSSNDIDINGVCVETELAKELHKKGKTNYNV